MRIISEGLKKSYFIAEDDDFLYIVQEDTGPNSGREEIYVSSKKYNDTEIKKFYKDNNLKISTYPATESFNETKLKQILKLGLFNKYKAL